MKRIAVAGFQHETNTFSPTLASFTEFEEADCWPGLLITRVSAKSGLLDCKASMAWRMEGCGVGRVRVKEWLVLSGSESSRNNTSKHVEINVPTTKNGEYILTLELVLVFQDATNTFRQIQAKYLLDNERPTDYGG